MSYLGAGITRFNTADDLTVTDDAEIQDDASVGGDLSVTGTTTLTDDLNVDSGTLFVDASENRVGIGTDSPEYHLHVYEDGTNTNAKLRIEADGTGNCDADLELKSDDSNSGRILFFDDTGQGARIEYNHNGEYLSFDTEGSEAMRISSAGALGIGTTDPDANIASDNGEGICFRADGQGFFSKNSGVVVYVNRKGNDGTLMAFLQAGSSEGSISVSGSTVSFNGGHLARWSRLENDSKDASIVKGTVLTNLDAMVEWSHETTYWTEKDELPEGVSIGDVKKEAYTEDNEQLNKMAVSSVEGDPNVAGVFVNWDNDDDFNDMNIAMTGDMVIRIAQGTTVERGDLLMSAGDGTAKPQGDDIVRSKTIAKVTSTHVSHTYDDGSYLVPCVLMAC